MALSSADTRAAHLGGVVLVLVAGAVAFAIFFADRVHIGASIRVQVYFGHVGALSEGASVMVAGKRIGVVDTIGLVPAAGLPADHPLAGRGGAVAYLRIDQGRRDMAPHNGEYFVSSRGALGERYLEIGPPRDGAAFDRPVTEGDRIRGIDPPSIDRALQNTYENLQYARAFARDVGPQARALVSEIQTLGGQLIELDDALGPGGFGDIRSRWQAAMTEAQDAWAQLGAAGADPAHLEAMAASVGRTAESLRAALSLLRGRAELMQAGLDHTLAKARGAEPSLQKLRDAIASAQTLTTKLDGVLAKVQDMAARFARGEGSLARLGSDPEFPEDAKELGKILKRTPWRVVGHPQDDDK
ncbi:MAG: MlaD family protein [Deltaproteobacteria bacterium]|nr:MlaD family protein [Deltaproteobacteria bacterium]